MNDGNVPGLFVAVVRGDSVLYQRGFGFADRESKRPITGKICMELGSVSKAFTAEIIYDLHQAGLLNINESIRRYFPGAPKSWENITIRHLLTHTSGIQNYLLDPRFKAESYFLGSNDLESERFFKTVSTDSMTRMFYSLPLEFNPGSTWSYSNTGYYLLGKIAESVTQKKFFELVRLKLTDPLRMDDTKANELASREDCLAKGYLLKDGILIPSTILTSNYAFSAGAWASTGEDMIRYLKAIHQKVLLSDRAGYDWRKVDPNGDLPFTYEGGHFYSSYHGMKVISHQGGTPGFSSSWFYVVDKKISVIVLINRQDYAAIDQMAVDILALFEPGLAFPGKTVTGEEAIELGKQLVVTINAIKNNTPYPLLMSKPLEGFMKSENGKGLWKWYFDRGFPDTAFCVDTEKTGNLTAYRFRLPVPGRPDYRLTVILNARKEWVQMRWW